MHSGKSTVANHLVDNHGFRRVSFAQPLKDDLLRMGFLQKDIDEKPSWMRRLMVAYGMARRAVNPNHWVEIAENFMGQEYGRVVCDDLRFPNEYEMLRRLSAQNDDTDVQIMRLMRLGYDREDIPGYDDDSETQLDNVKDWDIVLSAVSGDVPGLLQAAEKQLGLPHG